MLSGRLQPFRHLVVGRGGGEVATRNPCTLTTHFNPPGHCRNQFSVRFLHQQQQQQRHQQYRPGSVTQRLVRPIRRPKHTETAESTKRPPTSSSTSSTPATGHQTTAATTTTTINNNSDGAGSLYLGTHVWRLACAFGIVYVVTEYGIELTICEGPSMMPTIQPLGEVVIMDRCTPRLWGLQGGAVATDRAILARRLQRQHERVQRYAPTTPPRERTWYEERIPVNRLPREGTWKRLRDQLTTGISVGDVVVLQHPDRVGTVCKRVMGLPGDIVTKPSTRMGASRVYNRDGDQQTNLAALKRRRSAATMEIPDGHIWVEGDNPWNSSDSRTYGPVPASLIMGRVLCRVWPLTGNALMERGDRPVHDEETERAPSLAFSGSVIFPAGYGDQIIVAHRRRAEHVPPQ